MPFWHSLRGKGLLAMLAMLAYVAASTWYVSLERAGILESMGALQQVAEHEKALAVAEAAIDAARVDVAQAGASGTSEPMSPGELAMLMESSTRPLAALETFDASYAGLTRAIDRSHRSLAAARDRDHWIDLRETMARTAADLDLRKRNLEQHRLSLTTQYHQRYDAVTIESIGLAIAGIAVFGTVVAWFFARLTHDIRRLEHHARAVVQGARGHPLRSQRRDELGGLMRAVDQMADDLDAREKTIEFDHQRRSHVDKMSAVGALAAGVAHEVNNPLAVISGLAQELQSVDAPAVVREQATSILEHVQRAAFAARHLAEVAQPPPAALDWVDVNGLVRRTVDLMRFDKRYRSLQIESKLSPELPSIRHSGETVQHALMRALTVACDAALLAPQATRTVRVQSRKGPEPDCVEVVFGFDGTIDLRDPALQRTVIFTRSILAPMAGWLSIDPRAESPARIVVKLLDVPAQGFAPASSESSHG